MFQLLGTPTEDIWPGFSKLPNAKTVNFNKHPPGNLDKRFPNLSLNGLLLLKGLMCYNPTDRLTAQMGLEHEFFIENPAPKDPSMFPSFPSKSSGNHSRKIK